MGIKVEKVLSNKKLITSEFPLDTVSSKKSESIRLKSLNIFRKKKVNKSASMSAMSASSGSFIIQPPSPISKNSPTSEASNEKTETKRPSHAKDTVGNLSPDKITKDIL